MYFIFNPRISLGLLKIDSSSLSKSSCLSFISLNIVNLVISEFISDDSVSEAFVGLFILSVVPADFYSSPQVCSWAFSPFFN